MPAEDAGAKADPTNQPTENGQHATDTTEVKGEGRNDAPQTETQADEFGLPVRPARRRRWSGGEGEVNGEHDEDVDDDKFEDAEEGHAEEVSVQSTESPFGALPAGADKTATITQTEGDQTTRMESTVKDDVATADKTDPAEGKDEIVEMSTQHSRSNSKSSSSPTIPRKHAQSISEFSHQQVLAPPVAEEPEEDDGEWQAMPTYATHTIYDDWGKVLAKEYGEANDEQIADTSLGGAGKGYTRVQIDDDAQSATSMDDNTAYLFKGGQASNALFDDDEEGKDVISQMRTTKELLTEGQRVAYVGVVRLSMSRMENDLTSLDRMKGAKKQIEYAREALKMWSQKIMVRLYSHMDIDAAEQIMVEQLAEHGVLPADLTPVLMQNARVKNPTSTESETSSLKSGVSPRPSMSAPRPSGTSEKGQSSQNLSVPGTPAALEPPPPYEQHTADELTSEDRSQIEGNKNLDIDIRWTILCDMFLLLIADSTYDSRSRTLLEYVGSALSVEWQEVCRFEKRVTDALEMQEQADKENWNEEEHLESRRKAARTRRLMVMGLCTVGGGLVIGLSAGMLAPVIGAGLAAGFTTIGVAGTSTFLGGAGAAALIGTGGAVTGSIVGVRSSNRRTGSVKTFEYRPLFNNKRTNLIVTVSGWMTGKVDDVRLPFSTVDPIMGDIYSVHWEPEMLQSTGQTIQILATEALTQTIQQILANTVLTALMAGLSLPIILTKLSYLIDNPWTVSLARADATGLILADSIIDRNLGVRPITLVGFSLGSRVIFSCLKELAKRGALGLVQNAYMFGSPVVAKKEEYLRARTVVSGRFLNGYASNDWILGYLFRATSGGIMRVAGLSSVDVPGVENVDVTALVPGHMAYRGMMPTLLSEVGWLVDGLEFTEIEDPDPENHEKRQRELLNEIEAARQELEDKEKGGASGKQQSGFKSFFSRKKAGKKAWETYDERSLKVLEGDDKESERVVAEENVMFDVDAIRAEALKLALEEGANVEEIKAHLSVREIECTLPALRVESPKPTGGSASTGGLRQTKSYEDTTTTTTTSRSGLSNGVSNAQEEQIEMSFETPDPGPSRSGNASPATWGKTADQVPARSGTASPWQKSARSTPQPVERPELKTANSTPATSSATAHRNPWQHEEEEEVQMSFE